MRQVRCDRDPRRRQFASQRVRRGRVAGPDFFRLRADGADFRQRVGGWVLSAHAEEKHRLACRGAGAAFGFEVVDKPPRNRALERRAAEPKPGIARADGRASRGLVVRQPADFGEPLREPLMALRHAAGQ